MTLRTIIITGCSSGIGAYCAHQLKQDGWRVVASARKPEDIKALCDAGIETFYLDYTEEDSIDAFFDDALEACGGRIDALFNNGAYSQAGAVEDLPVEALRAQFDANFFGWHVLTQKVLPVMRQQNSGRIVQCSSILGLVAMRWRGAYNASKFALEGLSRTLALELANTGIKVSLIEPGPIESKIATNALPHILKHIDIENSHYKKDYELQLKRIRQGGSKGGGKLGPEAVYKVLDHALNAKNPKPHYLVTTPAKFGALMQRILPARFWYKFLAKQN